MLPDSPDLEKVVLGDHGVIEGVRSDSILVDMSSIAPLVSRQISETLGKKVWKCWMRR